MRLLVVHSLLGTRIAHKPLSTIKSRSAIRCRKCNAVHNYNENEADRSRYLAGAIQRDRCCRRRIFLHFSELFSVYLHRTLPGIAAEDRLDCAAAMHPRPHYSTMKYAPAPNTRNIGEVVAGGDVSPSDADSDDRKKTVIVLGSPRGGTSMTAGVLHILGISMGNVRSPDALNPKGYFEDRDFLDLGDELFKAADSSSNGFSPPAYEALTRQAGLFDERIRALVEQRSAACTGNAWGWKTAATSHCVDLFLPYLPRPYFIVVLRNPLSVAQSARRYVRHENRRHMYDKLSLAQGLRVAASYEAAIFAALERNPSIPTLLINYEQAVASPSSTIDTMVSFLDVEARASTRRKAKRFISSNGAKLQWNDRLKHKFWAVNRWINSEKA